MNAAASAAVKWEQRYGLALAMVRRSDSMTTSVMMVTRLVRKAFMAWMTRVSMGCPWLVVLQNLYQ